MRGCLACCCPFHPQRGLATQTSGSEDDTAPGGGENAVAPTMEEPRLVVSGVVIANGSAGVVVVHGRWDGRAVAVKRLQTADTEAVARAEREVQLMRGLPPHTHVLPLLHVVRGCGVYDLVLPLASKSLFDVVVGTGPLMPTRVRRVFAQVARAVAHLHSFGVVHRDVKLENLLMSSDSDHVWLADFDLAHCFPDLESATDGRLCGCTGSPSYAAPEVFYSGQRAYDAYKVDVWAMGVVLYALLLGTFPVATARYDVPEMVRAATWQRDTNYHTPARAFLRLWGHEAQTATFGLQAMEVLDTALVVEPGRRGRHLDRLPYVAAAATHF